MSRHHLILKKQQAQADWNYEHRKANPFALVFILTIFVAALLAACHFARGAELLPLPGAADNKTTDPRPQTKHFQSSKAALLQTARPKSIVNRQSSIVAPPPTIPVAIGWNPSAGANSYNVYRVDGWPQAPFLTRLLNTTSTEYRANLAATMNTLLALTVTAVNTNGESGYAARQ